MNVSRREILTRGLRGCCPNCGAHSLFESGRWFAARAECGVCGTRLERGEGFFLGAVTVNYGVTVFGVLLPLLLGTWLGWWPWSVALGAMALAAVVVPVVLYRLARSWWLMVYFWVLPHQLPANAQPGEADDEEPRGGSPGSLNR
jgi:uncharacterized protein (DUF983 family)